MAANGRSVRSKFAHRLGAIAIAAASLAFSSAGAQGGPPFVTDDPATPGAGNWEINIAGIASHPRGAWDLTGPDADVNYGWGDRIQLKLDMNWTTEQAKGERTRTGLGTSAVGVKWRMIGGEESGFSVSSYPQLVLQNPSDPNKALFVPLEAATSIGAFQLDVEAGPTLVQRGPDEWAMGLIVAHACGARFECAAEIHDTLVAGGHMTLLNLGFRYRISKRLLLLGAAGRDFGSPPAERQQLLLFLGIQVVT